MPAKVIRAPPWIAHCAEPAFSLGSFRAARSPDSGPGAVWFGCGNLDGGQTALPGRAAA